MDSRKLIVRISYGLNALLIVTIVGLLVYYQYRPIRQMSDTNQKVPLSAAISDSNTLAETNTQTAPNAEGGVGQLEAKVETLRYQLEAAEEELEMTREDLANKMGMDEEFQDMIAMEKKMWENPVEMNRRRRMMENFITKEYGALFEKLGLPDEKLQDFRTLLVDNYMQEEKLDFLQMDQSLQEEESKEIQQQLENQKTKFEEQARELLGAENYEIYYTYNEQFHERLMLFDEPDPLGASLGLSVEKEQALIDAMYEARKEVFAEYGIDTTGVKNIIWPEDLVESMNMRLDVYNSYIESGRRVLSGSQAEQFEARMSEDIESIKITLSQLESGDYGP